MTAKDAYDKFISIGEELFTNFINKWTKGEKILSKPQDNANATYFPKGLPNNGKIDWSWSGEKIYNFIRALTFEPFDPPFFTIGKKEMVIIDKKFFKKNKI
jgi:methionyl-tRNA formyltransferase